jgi:GNAT superfamily N-acetyltransferase
MNPQLDKAPVAVLLPACHVRRGMPADAGALSVFAVATFTDTYGRHNRPEDLQRHLDASFGLRQQFGELSDPAVTTLLAHVDGQLAAYAQVRNVPAPACVSGAAPIELHRLYVDRTWHGRGVGQHLLAQARVAALALGGVTLWLKVWEKNARAIAFYAKAGLANVGIADFFVGTDRQTDCVLTMDLRRQYVHAASHPCNGIEEGS